MESIREYAKKTFGWTKKRTDEVVLPVIKRLSEKTSQQSIQNYFKVTGITSKKDLKVSKRVRLALDHMDPDGPPVSDDVTEEKKPRKKATKKPTTNSEEQNDADKDSSFEAKPKPRRKRKAIPEPEKEQIDNHLEPSTSTGSKKVILPDNNAPIPQREKDKQMMESNRLKAIEVLKKMKANKK